MLVVVAVLGLLFAIAVPQISRAGKAAREQKLRADLQTVRDAMERMAADTGFYPEYPTDLLSQSPPSNGYQAAPVPGGWIYAPLPGALWKGPYLKSYPKLPAEFGGDDDGSKSVIHRTTGNRFEYGWVYDSWNPSTSGHAFRLPLSTLGTDGTPYNSW
jgi:type II secretory pathway pseudopilin PulG